MANLNITSTLGITLPAGTEAEDVQKTESVEVAELLSQSSGETIKADPVNVKETKATISGDGPVDLALVTAGVIATPADLEIISMKVAEAPNKRCTFSLDAAGHSAFVDPAAAVAATGAEPTIADLEIVSVEYSVAESVDRSYSVTDSVLIGTDGTPAARGKVTVKGSFSINGRGDLPAGVALGSGGAAFKGGDAGKVLVESLMTGEKRADWNRWSVDGSHHKSAA